MMGTEERPLDLALGRLPVTLGRALSLEWPGWKPQCKALVRTQTGAGPCSEKGVGGQVRMKVSYGQTRSQWRCSEERMSPRRQEELDLKVRGGALALKTLGERRKYSRKTNRVEMGWRHGFMLSPPGLTAVSKDLCSACSLARPRARLETEETDPMGMNKLVARTVSGKEVFPAWS